MQTIKEATTYIMDNIKNIDNPGLDDIDEEIIHEDILDFILNSYENKFDESDLDVLDQRGDDDDFVEEFLRRRFSNFEEVLENAVKEILTEYVLEENVLSDEDQI